MAKRPDFYKNTNGYTLRRLTPIECARLQTVPEWYEWIVSDSQIYKMLGNGWTIEVIKHIFSFLPYAKLKSILSIFDNDAHNIVSKNGWKKLNNNYEYTNITNKEKMV